MDGPDGKRATRGLLRHFPDDGILISFSLASCSGLGFACAKGETLRR
jgi:hypothetical protein